MDPQPGFLACDLAHTGLRLFDEQNWIGVESQTPELVSRFGINTSSDLDNLLSIASDATLFVCDASGGGVPAYIDGTDWRNSVDGNVIVAT